MLLGSLLLITSLCSQCGPTVDPSTTQAIIQVESGGNPYAIGDNTLKKSFAPKSKEAAVQLAAYLLAQGHNLDLGLMQVNSCHLKTMKFTLVEIFDPCRNIAIGTTILSDFYRRHNTGEDKKLVLFKALSAYNTGSAWRGPGYVNKVLKAAGAPYRITVVNPPPKARAKTATNERQAERLFTAGEATLFFPGTAGAGGLQGL
ncbi:MAG: lytic transglycosylase domain-containing protein [Desulfobulbus sp.]|nr:lytic transglycosylase domain-containing protein [Desulfobulbus sp.]